MGIQNCIDCGRFTRLILADYKEFGQGKIVVFPIGYELYCPGCQKESKVSTGRRER